MTDPRPPLHSFRRPSSLALVATFALATVIAPPASADTFDGCPVEGDSKGDQDLNRLKNRNAQASSFEDLETGEQLPVVPQSFADEYRKLIAQHVESLASKFSEHRVDFAMLNTKEPLDRALFSYLSSRERRMRVR